ncbi:MAG: DEAD/DEAH box helicase [Candidatus Moraniibacteriota bacterium]
MSFHNLGIAPQLFQILEHHKFTVPTPIQAQSIPIAISGKDVMGIAQTGTGKTLAFGIPMVQRLAQKRGAMGLALLPTRELALQVEEALQKFTRPLGLKTVCLIGGESMSPQLRGLRNNPDIIIATPGRLIDHLDRKSARLDKVSILILDEADHMLDMGFAPQLNRIMTVVPKERQTMLFSATMAPAIVRIATSYMKLPVRVEVAPQGTAVETVTQELFFVAHMEKLTLLEKLLNEYQGSVLVFTRTKFIAKRIALSLRNHGFTAAEIHSNRSQGQRREALDGFKVGRYRVLVATDIAARGIDVSGIEVVINYDLPEKAEDYVHRIGRTARAGKTGRAISFATPDQRGNVKDIERLTRLTLPIAGHVGVIPSSVANTPDSVRPFHPTRRRSGFHSRRRR